MRSADDLGVWERLDDVIMGGQSDSALRPAEGGGECLPHHLPLYACTLNCGYCGDGCATHNCVHHQAISCVMLPVWHIEAEPSLNTIVTVDAVFGDACLTTFL